LASGSIKKDSEKKGTLINEFLESSDVLRAASTTDGLTRLRQVDPAPAVAAGDQQILDMLLQWQTPSRPQSWSAGLAPPATGGRSTPRSTVDGSWSSLLCCEVEPEWLGAAAAGGSGTGTVSAALSLGIIMSNSVPMSSSLCWPSNLFSARNLKIHDELSWINS